MSRHSITMCIVVLAVAFVVLVHVDARAWTRDVSEGVGTLEQAINDANGTPDPDTLILTGNEYTADGAPCVITYPLTIMAAGVTMDPGPITITKTTVGGPVFRCNIVLGGTLTILGRSAAEPIRLINNAGSTPVITSGNTSTLGALTLDHVELDKGSYTGQWIVWNNAPTGMITPTNTLTNVKFKGGSASNLSSAVVELGGSGNRLVWNLVNCDFSQANAIARIYHQNVNLTAQSCKIENSPAVPSICVTQKPSTDVNSTLTFRDCTFRTGGPSRYLLDGLSGKTTYNFYRPTFTGQCGTIAFNIGNSTSVVQVLGMTDSSEVIPGYFVDFDPMITNGGSGTGTRVLARLHSGQITFRRCRATEETPFAGVDCAWGTLTESPRVNYHQCDWSNGAGRFWSGDTGASLVFGPYVYSWNTVWRGDAAAIDAGNEFDAYIDMRPGAGGHTGVGTARLRHTTMFGPTAAYLMNVMPTDSFQVDASIVDSSATVSGASNQTPSVTAGWTNLAWDGADGHGFPALPADTAIGDPHLTLDGHLTASSTAALEAAGSSNQQVDIDGDDRPLPDLTPRDIGADETEFYPPECEYINRNNPLAETTNASTVQFRVHFNEAVTGVGTGNFTLTKTDDQASPSVAITQLTGAGSDYYVTVSTASGEGTIRLDLANAAGIQDGQNNAMTATHVGDEIYTIDRKLPTLREVTRFDPVDEWTNATEVTFRLVFSEAVLGVGEGNFAPWVTAGQTGAAVSGVSGADDVWYVTVDTVPGEGDLSVQLSVVAGITDLLGNAMVSGSPFFPRQAYHIDRVAPEVASINRGSPTAQRVSETEVTFAVTFDEAVDGVAAGSFSLVKTGTISGETITDVSGADDTWTVTVTVDAIPCMGTLALRLNQNLDLITDAVGNPMETEFTTGQTYIIDRQPPEVLSIVRHIPSAEKTNAARVKYAVTFNESVSGVAEDCFRATGTGSLSGVSIVDVTGVDEAWIVEVETLAGDGQLTIVLDQNLSNVVDSVGNAMETASGVSEAYRIDHIPPAVSSIQFSSPLVAETNAAQVTFLVLFTDIDGVTNVLPNNFTIDATGGQVGASVMSVTPLGALPAAAWFVQVATVNGGVGTLSIDLNQNLSAITDDVGNPMSTPYTTGQTYTIDRKAPTVVSILRSSPVTERTNAAQVTFAVTFDEPVTGLTPGNFTPVGTDAQTAATIDSVGGAGTAWTVTVNAAAGSGTLTVDLDSSLTTVLDALGNWMLTGRAGDEAYVFDFEAPYVTGIVRHSPIEEMTNAGQVVFAVTFNEAVFGLDETDFSIHADPGQQASTVSAVTGAGTDWLVTVETALGSGYLGIDLDQNLAGITDEATNAMTTPYSTGEQYYVDRQAPKVIAITNDTGSPTQSSTVQFTVTFDKVVLNFGEDSDLFVEIAPVGSLTYSTPILIADLGGHDIYTVTFNGLTGDGLLEFGVNATSDVRDLIGNPLEPSGIKGSVVVDNQGPAAVSIARFDPPEAVTNAPQVTFAVTFGEPVVGVSPANFAAVGTLDQSAATIAGVSGTAPTAIWTVTLDTVPGEGDLTVDLVDTTGIGDELGNAMTAPRAGDEWYTLDRQPPVVQSITLDTASPINASATAQFTVAFDEAVVNFDSVDDLLFTATGTVLRNTFSLRATASPDTYLVEVGATGDGALSFIVDDTVCDVEDTVGNPLAPSAAVPDVVVIDNTRPVVTFGVPVLSPPSGDNKVNRYGSVTFPVQYTDAHAITITLKANDVFVTPSGGVSPTWDVSVDASSNPALVTVSHLEGDGQVRITVAADTSYDAAGNHDTGPGALVYSSSVTVDNSGPLAVFDSPTPTLVNEDGSVLINVHFNDLDWNSANLTAVTVNASAGIVGTPTVSIEHGATRHPVVTLDGCQGDGTISITVPPGSAWDTLGNTNAAATSLTFSVDNTPPTAYSITHGITGPTAATQVTFTVLFSEAVIHFNDDLDFDETGTVVHTGTQVSPATGPAATYSVKVTGIDGNGTLALAVSTAGDIVDRAGNALADSVWCIPITIDQTALSVLDIAPNTAGPEWWTEPGVLMTRADAIELVVQFSTDVTAFDPSDLNVITTGTVLVANTPVIAPMVEFEDTYTVTLSGITGDGMLQLGFVMPSDIHDLPGNLLTGGILVSDPAIQIDNTGPVVSAITPETLGPTMEVSLDFAVAFSEAVLNFDDHDVLITETGDVLHTNTQILPAVGPADAYTVTFNGITGDGTMKMSVSLYHDIVDRVGNPLAATLESAEVTIVRDLIQPKCLAITALTPSPTNLDEIEYRVRFSEPMKNFNAMDDLTMMTTEDVTYGSSITVVDIGDHMTYNVTFPSVGGDGNFSFLVNVASDVRDLYNNKLSSSVEGEVTIIDNTPPEILFSEPEPAVTAEEPVEFIVTYYDRYLNEGSITLAAADVTLVNTSGKDLHAPRIEVETVSTTQRKIIISDLRDSNLGLGVVQVQITRSGTAMDRAGNAAPPSDLSPPFTVKSNLPVAWWPVALALLAVGGLGLWARRRRSLER